MKYTIYKIMAGLCLALFLFGCGTQRQLTTTRVETVYNYKDSLVIDTLEYYVPLEVYREYTALLDTLRLETSLAEAYAVVDTNYFLLKGEIRNKPEEPIEIPYQYITKEVEVVRDSIVIKEIPVEVVKEKKVTPKWAWYSVVFNIIESVILGLLIYFLFLKKFWL